MSNEIELLKMRAEEGRILYIRNEITRKEAQEQIMPYINAVNAKAEELARKYQMKKVRKVTFSSFAR
jgi:hypothetical protein